MWFHHAPIYGIHTAAYHGVAIALGNYNTCKRFHTQCIVYVLCVHVCMYVHMKLHMHTLCVCECVHEQSMDHISLKRNGPTYYNIVIHYAGYIW